MTRPIAPEAPRPQYNPATDPYRAEAEAFYAAHDAAMERRVQAPAQPRELTPDERVAAVVARQAEDNVANTLARHTQRWAEDQRYDRREPYIPGKTLLGMYLHNYEDMNGTGPWAAVKALGRLVASGQVERRGRIPGLRTYHMAPNQAAQRRTY